jgi:predicted DNA-binding protein
MAQQPLDEAGGTAPRISVRLARPKHDRVVELAEATGGTVSALIRELVDRELDRLDMEPLASG